MSEQIPPKTAKPKPVSIRHNLGIALSNSSQWITSADVATIAAAERLAVLLDSIYDTGEDLDKLASLLGRFEGLLKQLKLTPVARDATTGTAEVNHGQQFAESYLRLVSAEDSKPKTRRAKPRSTGQ
jgi:hypothetical protein